MKRILLIVGLGGAVAAGAYAVLRPGETPPAAPSEKKVEKGVAAPRHGRRQAEWDAYGYQLKDGPQSRRYDLPAVIRTQAGKTPHVRVLLNVQDERNYYFVELTPEGSRIGRAESGLELSIGTQGQGLRPDGTNRLIIKRRPYTIEAVLNSTVVARAEDETFHGGRIGAGVRGQSAQVKLERPQPCHDISLQDGFMRTAAEDTGWEAASGSWKVNELRNPSLSSNAFYYVGQASKDGSAAAVRGQWFWDDYRFRVAAMSEKAADVGLFIYYRDADNCYFFRWNADQQPGGKRGRKQLVKRWRGEETVLAEQAGGYQPGVWYELEAEVIGQRLRAFIDGHQVFSVTDPNLCFGQVGLYTATEEEDAVRFDDVVVDSVRAFHDNFSAEMPGRWNDLRGQWERRAVGDGHARVVSAEQPARCVAGSRRWRDYLLSSHVRLPARLSGDGTVGLIGRYLDEMNYALFTWVPARGVARLEVVVGGNQVAEDEAEVARGLPDTRHALDLEWKHNVVTARVDGRRAVSAWVPSLPRGKVGLYASLVNDLAFEDCRVTFPAKAEPVLTSHEVFSREHSMQIWAGAAQDWHTTSERVDGHGAEVSWHRANLFGDASIEAELPEDAAPDGKPKASHLILSAGETSATTGYRFTLAWPEGGEKKEEYTADILRKGEPAAHGTVSLSRPPRLVRFDRLGPHLIASVNNQQVLGFKDEQPLGGTRVAFADHHLEVPKEAVKIYSDTVQIYTFSRASSHWRPAAGTWSISNRWECDPRWSFFSGVPEKGEKLAAIWNKHAYHGDISVEFAIGPKMENDRGGSRYSYVRDFNVTIAGDGRDLTSGYTFLFGGWGNKRTAITRQGKVVAKKGRDIPTGGIHRRWFYVKVSKRGDTLTYSIDGEPVLTYTDPQPLDGTRVAIWTYDCGIMVSRVRINAARIGGMEAPGTPPGPGRTIYGGN